ncbi:ABC transporter permease [Actinomadura rubrisoli]|uniref:ABC transporter permease n=1 Tax=Actinomadura rubrisoli TaxID=2530368 RepID=UPI001404686C|nr:ABC transporter permease [Actinomadura rubrisoli]
MRSHRPALRMARRDALRSKGRTALVLCMIGLPVTVIVALAVLLKTSAWSPREELPYEIGAADARLTDAGRVPVQQRPDDDEFSTSQASGGGNDRPWTTAEITRQVTAKYGPGARVLPWSKSGLISLKTTRGYLRAELTGLDVRDPMARGLFKITKGRAPAAPGEIALSPSFGGHGFPIGALAQVDRDGTKKRVVGYVKEPRQPGAAVALTLPGAFPGRQEPLLQWLIDAGKPVTWADVTEFNKSGITVLSRAVVLDPPPPPPADSPLGGEQATRGAEPAVAAMIAAMIVLEVVLLAGPAFAVGMRRQRRQLALVAAAGGEARHLRAVVLASGLVLGGAAALGGAVLGLLGAAAAKPAVEAWRETLLGPFDVPWSLVALTMALGAGSGLLAAYAPARQAGRMDVVAALAGRRDGGRARRGWPIAGAVVIAGGAVVCLVGVRSLREFGAAIGAAAIILGCVMAAPWVVGAAGRLARGLPLPLRLAVRDGSRNRGRAAPAVAAIMAAVAGITALAIGAASDFQQQRQEYQAQLPMGTTLVRPPADRVDAVGRAVQRELPGVPVLPVRALPGENSICEGDDPAKCPSVSFSARPPGDHTQTIILGSVVGGAREARLVLGRDDPAVAAALAAGKIVLFGTRPLAQGTTTATISVWDDEREEPRAIRKVPGLPAVGFAEDPHVQALVPPSLAGRVGLPVRTEAFGVDRADHRVTKAEQSRLEEALRGFTEDDGSVYVERGFTGSFNETLLFLAAAAAVLTLGGALIATGLSSADARPDLATLAAVGARPRTRRLLMMGQAGFIAALGCWLGIAAGLVPGIAAARPLTDEPSDAPGGAHGPIVVFPWPLLLVIGIAVPLVAATAAGLFTRSRLPMSQRVA